MNNFALTLSIALLWSLLHFSPQAPVDSSPLNTVLKKMDTAAANFRTTQAEFEWDTYEKVIDEVDDIQTGTIYYRRVGKEVEMMADVKQAGGPVDDRTDVVAVALGTGATMQGDAYPDGRAWYPGLSGDSALDGHRRQERGNRVGEHRSMRVGDRLEDDAAARLDPLADNVVVAGRRGRHGIAVGLPQPETALDIGE